MRVNGSFLSDNSHTHLITNAARQCTAPTYDISHVYVSRCCYVQLNEFDLSN